jgi:hypothetical protein
VLGEEEAGVGSAVLLLVVEGVVGGNVGEFVVEIEVEGSGVVVVLDEEIWIVVELVAGVVLGEGVVERIGVVFGEGMGVVVMLVEVIGFKVVVGKVGKYWHLQLIDAILLSHSFPKNNQQL